MLKSTIVILKSYLISIIILIIIAAIFSYIGDLIFKKIVVVDSSNSYLFKLSIRDYLEISGFLCLLTAICYYFIEKILALKNLLLRCMVSFLIMSVVIILFGGFTWGFTFNPFSIKTLISYGLSAFIFPILLSKMQTNRKV